MLETFQARGVQSDGQIVGTWTHDTIQALMSRVDVAIGAGYVWNVTIRGEHTSDGTQWGIGRGRAVAERDPHGRWRYL